MDISMLHTVTEDFASHLSEVTISDITIQTPCDQWSIKDLYAHAIAENLKFAASISGEKATTDPTRIVRNALDAARLNEYGGGLEHSYRQAARRMEAAFACADDPDAQREVSGVTGPRPVAVLLNMQIADTAIHTWDLATACGFEYEPEGDVAHLVLRQIATVPDTARGAGRTFSHQRSTERTDVSTFGHAVLLSGRAL